MEYTIAADHWATVQLCLFVVISGCVVLLVHMNQPEPPKDADAAGRLVWEHNDGKHSTVNPWCPKCKEKW